MFVGTSILEKNIFSFCFSALENFLRAIRLNRSETISPVYLNDLLCLSFRHDVGETTSFHLVRYFYALSFLFISSNF
jgi:hypothetical protein